MCRARCKSGYVVESGFAMITCVVATGGRGASVMGLRMRKFKWDKSPLKCKQKGGMYGYSRYSQLHRLHLHTSLSIDYFKGFLTDADEW